MMKDIKAYWINMGKIIGAHGIKGQLKVYSYTRPEKQILDYKKWHLSKKDYEWTTWETLSQSSVMPVTIKSGSQKGNGTLMVTCIDIDDRNHAESLRDNYIYINGSDLPKLSSGEYYWFQLVGLDVVNLDGYEFGQVTELFDNGANDVMVVSKEVDVLNDEEGIEKSPSDLNKTDNPKALKEVYLPYDMSYIDKIDIEAGLITIDWPEEL